MSKEEIQLKYIVIGASGGGKTSILRRLAENRFLKGTQSTVGIEYFTYQATLEGQPVKLMLWDTAGQERFYTIAKAYFRGAIGVILVFDICDRKSFDQLPKWLRDARIEADPNCIVMLVGNKVDLADRRCVSREEAEEFARTHDMEYLETSAKKGTNIEEVFLRSATEILHKAMKGEIQSVGTGQTLKQPTVNINIDEIMNIHGEDGRKNCC